MKPLVNRRNRFKNFILSPNTIKITTVALILAAWELFFRIGLLSPFKLPPPSNLLKAIWELSTKGYPSGKTVLVHIKSTFWRIFQGYMYAAVSAIPLGILIGSSNILDRLSANIITFARAIATISLLPLVIAWFGVGEVSRVILIWYGCFWVMITNTIQGVKLVDINLINAGRMLGANKKQIFSRVILPSASPRIFAGMKIAVGVAFMVIIAVEMIGTTEGLGALIQGARYFYDTDITIAGMIIIGVIGLIFSVVLDRVERILLPWASSLKEVKR